LDPEKLKKVYDKAVNDSIEQIPTTSFALKEGELDVKVHVDNEMDFYLGAVMATIFEKFECYAKMEGFTKQQIDNVSVLTANDIFQMIPTLKEKIKEQVGL
jgi:hypothetical protein